jgi:hypothetical protein
MNSEPSYPEDTPVAGPTGEEERDGDKPAASNRTRHMVTGAAIGIGSAALVAALLYANRSRKGGGGERK